MVLEGPDKGCQPANKDLISVNSVGKCFVLEGMDKQHIMPFN